MQLHSSILVSIVVMADFISCDYIINSTTFCDGGWTEHNNKCYKYFPGDVYTWQEGQSKCADEDGTLPTAKIQNVNNFLTTIRSTVTANRGSNRDANVWLNGRWDDGWKWQDDHSPLVWMHWARHRSGIQEPTRGSNRYTEDCMAMLLGGQWADVNCNWHYSLVCEKPKTFRHFPVNGCPISPSNRNDYFMVGQPFQLNGNRCEVCTCEARDIIRCRGGYCRDLGCHTVGDWDDDHPNGCLRYMECIVGPRGNPREPVCGAVPRSISNPGYITRA